MTAAPLRVVTRPQPVIRVHLGCGSRRMEVGPEWVNADLSETPATDVTFDCQDRWPFPDNSVAEVYACHVLEHLPRPRDLFREMWRCLLPGASVLFRLPYGDHRAAMADVEHVRPWYPESFAFLQPGYAEATGSTQHAGWAYPYGVVMTQLRLIPEMAPLVKTKFRRRVTVRLLPYLQNVVHELWAHLVPLKTPADLATWRAQRLGNAVPVTYMMYRHDLWGTKAGENPLEVIPLAEIATQF